MAHIKVENKEEERISLLLVAEVLILRVSYDATLQSMIRHLQKIHNESGVPLPSPFDGGDASEELPIYIAEAAIRVQKLLLELPAINRRTDKTPMRQMMAESKLREVDMILQQALKVSIEAHLMLQGVL